MRRVLLRRGPTQKTAHHGMHLEFVQQLVGLDAQRFECTERDPVAYRTAFGHTSPGSFAKHIRKLQKTKRVTAI